MKQYLALLLVVSGLSAWSEFDAGIGEHRDELLPLVNFEPFVYVLFIFSGTSILLSLKPHVAEGVSNTFILPFSASLTGWGVGLSLAQALDLDFSSAAVGVVLSAVMAFVTLSPAIIATKALKLAEDLQNRWFAKRLQVWAVNLLGIWLFGSGCAGLMQPYFS